MAYSDEVQEYKPDRTRRKRKPFNLKVLVYDIKTDTCIRERTLDYSDSGAKAWLTHLIYWAANNGKSVEILNIIDDK